MADKKILTLALGIVLLVSTFYFVSASENFKINSSAGTILFANGTSGNIGIGTNSPGERLVVGNDIGGSAFTTPTYRMSVGGPNTASVGYDLGSDTNNRGGMLWHNSSSYIEFFTKSSGTSYSNTLNLYQGNVGIGTSSPNLQLDVGGNGTIGFNGGILTANTGLSGLFWNGYTPAYGLFKTAGSWSAPNYQQLEMQWNTGIIIDGGTAYAKSGTIIQPNGGNVGIGTTNPGSKLSVQGEFVSNSSSGTLKISPNAYAHPAVYALTSAGGVSDLLLNPAGGNVGIGTTSPTDATLEIAGPSGAGANELLAFEKLSGYGGTGFYQYYNSAQDYGLQIGKTDGTKYITLNNYNGNVGIGTTSPSNLLTVSTGTTGQGIDLVRTGTGAGTGTIYNDGGFHIKAEGTSTGNIFMSATGFIQYRTTASGTTVDQLGIGSGQNTYFNNGGNVGIGTTSPGAPLVVQSTTASYNPSMIINASDPGAGATRFQLQNSVSALYLSAYGSGSPGLLANSTAVTANNGDLLLGGSTGSSIYLFANNAYTSPQVTISGTNGNVGIGTTNPQNTLNVVGDGNFTGNLYSNGALITNPDLSGYFNNIANFTGTLTNGKGCTYNSGTGKIDCASTFLTSYTETDPKWTGNSTLVPYLASVNTFTANNIFNQNLTVATNALFVNGNTGKVGIGTTSPSDKLSIHSDNTASFGYSGAQMNIGDNFQNWTLGLVYDNGNEHFSIGKASSEYFSIQTSNGNVGIGTASPGAKLYIENGSTSSRAGNLLTIDGDTVDTIPSLGSNGGKVGILNQHNYGLVAGVLGNGNAFEQVQRVDGTATAYNLLLQPNGGKVGIGTTSPSYQLQLSTDSAAKPSTNTWTVASDRRIKTNITYLTNYSENLNWIKNFPNAITYNYNGLYYNNTGLDYGFIAQDVNAYAPLMVSHSNVTLTNGSKIDLLSVNTNELDVRLLPAVKGLIQQNEEMNHTITQLQSQNDELQKEICILDKKNETGKC